MAFIVTDNIKIYYETYGKKTSEEKIVFLSGAGWDSSIWKNQIEYLKKDFYIIAVDHRGSGKSDCPDYNYNASMLSSDLEKILVKEEIDQINLVGHSIGGLVAEKFVNNNIKKVKRLILMNCSLGGGNPDIILPTRDVANMFLFHSVLTQEDQVKNALDYNFGNISENDGPDLYKEFTCKFMRNINGLPHLIPIMVSNKPLIQDYTKINMPVLCILAIDDPVTPHENGTIFQKYLPHARLEYLPGYHLSVLIHPGKVSSLIEQFINNN